MTLVLWDKLLFTGIVCIIAIYFFTLFFGGLVLRWLVAACVAIVISILGLILWRIWFGVS